MNNRTKININMRNTNTNDNEVKAIATNTYKNVIKRIVEGGMLSEKNINPSLINFMPEENNKYYICYDCMSCNARINQDEVDQLERELCKSAFGGWSIWGTWEAHF